MKELQYLGYSLTFEFVFKLGGPLIDNIRLYPGYKNTYFDENGNLIKE